MINLAISDVDGIEFVENVSRVRLGYLLANMHTTYQIAGGVVYYINGRTFILPNDSADGYEVILNERVNEFITAGTSDLFDLLVFIEL